MEGTVASVPPQGGRKHPQQEFLQVDTTNILFICGGAFAGLDKLIESRGKGSSIGFGAKVRNKKDQLLSEIMKQLEPEDLIKYLILRVQHPYYFLFHDLIFYNDCEQLLIKFL